MYFHTHIKPRNFYDIYTWQISAKLKRIDIYIKTNMKGISASKAAALLEISEQEVRHIMELLSIKKIHIKNFFEIMQRGSSELCRYMMREAILGFPHVYTMNEVAYIYGLDIDDVFEASRITGIKEATAATLPVLFCHIPA